MKLYLSYAATLLALGLLLSACASLSPLEEPPRVSLIGLKPVSIELLEQRYDVRLRVQNPNTVDLAIQGLDYTIEINDKTFARGVSDQDLLIPPFSERVMEVSVSSNLYSFIRQLGLLKDNARSFNYRISGRIAIKGIAGTIAFSHDGELIPGALKGV